MKHAIKFISFPAVAFVIWSVYTAHVNEIKNGVQGDPVRTVETFMNVVTGMSTLMWNEERQEDLRREMDEWEASADRLSVEDVKEELKEYGIENVHDLFEEERLAKGTLSALCLHEIESFTIDRTQVNEDNATVTVSFRSKGVLGLDKVIDSLGAPNPAKQRQPISVPFYLEKRRYRWRIVDVRGEMADPIKAMRKLR